MGLCRGSIFLDPPRGLGVEHRNLSHWQGETADQVSACRPV